MDPYQGRILNNLNEPFFKKRDVLLEIVVVLRGKLDERGLQLIAPPSTAVNENEIHEMIITDDPNAHPGQTVNSIAYLGFVEVKKGGVLLYKDEVIYNNNIIGHIVGFDESHMPNHLNIIISSNERNDGIESGLDLNLNIIIKTP